MTPIKFKKHNLLVAEKQDEYMTLPVWRYPYGDSTGRLVFCWKLSWKERIKIFFTGILWHQVLTFNKPLQPQLLSLNEPEMQD